MKHISSKILLLLAIAALLLSSVAGLYAEVKGPTIIVMIGDGMGFKHVEVAKNYLGAPLTMQTLPVQLGCTTFNYTGSYDSDLAWKDFNYVKNGATDSGASATAIATGIKTTSGRISVNHDASARLQNVPDYVKERGWAVGLLSSVPFSHATPAAFGAHNTKRNFAKDIAQEMVTSRGDGTGAWGDTPTADVIISGGHPNYKSGWISGEDYEALQKGTTGQGWTFVERKPGVSGTTSLLNAAKGATKLFGLYGGPDRCLPYRLADGSGRNYENPTLAEMTTAALTVLGKHTAGRFLMVEGGAIDWAGEDNNIDHLIGEMIDYDQAVAAVVNWVNANDPTWSNTLLIVTADHETGYLTRGKDVFSNVPLGDPGKGVMPVEGTHFFWNSKGHTNSLVPVYAKGYKSEMLTELAKNYDAGIKLNYLDNTDFIKVMKAIYEDPEAPSVPANVQVSAQSPDSVLVSWNASTGKKEVIGYKIYCNGSLVGTSTTTSFTSKVLEPDKNYAFIVQSYDADGKQSAKSAPPAVYKTPTAQEKAEVKLNGGELAAKSPTEPALAR